jgi:hypothetical protein
MPSPGQSTLFNVFTELVSTTYRNHKKSFADNVSTHNALWRRLNEKGRIRLEDGGLSIVCPLEYATNSTFQRYSGFDTLNIQAVDVLTAAEFAWKQAAENVAISGLEMRSNSGESRIINFTKAKIKNAMNSFKQQHVVRHLLGRHGLEPDRRLASARLGCWHRNGWRDQLLDLHVLEVQAAIGGGSRCRAAARSRSARPRSNR